MKNLLLTLALLTAVTAAKPADASFFRRLRENFHHSIVDPLRQMKADQDAAKELQKHPRNLNEGPLTLADGWTWRQDDGVVHVYGTVTNQTDHAYQYVEVRFQVLDAAGNLLDVALANTTALASHQTWHFDAIALSCHGAKSLAWFRPTGS